ncbi:DUF4232 domain-containing protein [Streptomyces sp. NPDC049099]|uniref:DUF4232 domain-containing protein n=1 Tax=Streptomyces sp. NPDC049099 TaxID=3155768 RepID=UPI00343E276C
MRPRLPACRSRRRQPRQRQPRQRRPRPTGLRPAVGAAIPRHNRPERRPGARTAACPTRYLKARPGTSQGTAGSVYQVIDFTNIAQTTCTLYGYPGVSLAGGSPVHQIGQAATRSTTAPRALVTLAPGATGNALLRITDAGNYPTTQCSWSTASASIRLGTIP